MATALLRKSKRYRFEMTHTSIFMTHSWKSYSIWVCKQFYDHMLMFLLTGNDQMESNKPFKWIRKSQSAEFRCNMTHNSKHNHLCFFLFGELSKFYQLNTCNRLLLSKPKWSTRCTAPILHVFDPIAFSLLLNYLILSYEYIFCVCHSSKVGISVTCQTWTMSMWKCHTILSCCDMHIWIICRDKTVFTF